MNDAIISLLIILIILDIIIIFALIKVFYSLKDDNVVLSNQIAKLNSTQHK